MPALAACSRSTGSAPAGAQLLTATDVHVADYPTVTAVKWIGETLQRESNGRLRLRQYHSRHGTGYGQCRGCDAGRRQRHRHTSHAQGVSGHAAGARGQRSAERQRLQPRRQRLDPGMCEHHALARYQHHTLPVPSGDGIAFIGSVWKQPDPVHAFLALERAWYGKEARKLKRKY